MVADLKRKLFANVYNYINMEDMFSCFWFIISAVSKY